MARVFGRSSEDAARVSRAVLAHERQATEARAERRGPRGESGGSVRVRAGRVSTATSPTITLDGDAMEPGTLEAWEFVTPESRPAFNASESYVAGNYVRHYVIQEANTAVSPGTYSADDWDDIAEDAEEYPDNPDNVAEHDETASYAVGDQIRRSVTVYRANTNVSAGAFNAAQWDSTTASDLIDRNQPTVSLRHRLDGDLPAEGTLVAWMGEDVVVLPCGPPTEWV